MSSRSSSASSSMSRHQRRDEEFKTAADEWVGECASWNAGTHPDLIRDPSLKAQYPYYWQWAGNPPDEAYRRPTGSDEKGVQYQIHETVGGSAPVSGRHVVLRMRTRALRRQKAARRV